MAHHPFDSDPKADELPDSTRKPLSSPHISLVIPSALRRMPPGADGDYWLTRTIHSALAQTLPPAEIIVGLDPGVHLPGEIMRLATPAVPIRQANGDQPGHQAACNAAAKRANGPLLAFLEDDDEWTPSHLKTLVRVMDETDAGFVSSSQAAVNGIGVSLNRPFDYPTASGWLMSRLTWHQMGGFDTRFRIHHDNAFLAQLNAQGIARAHVVEVGAGAQPRPELALIARHARIISSGLPELTVRRTFHGESIMGGVARDESRRQQSAKEYAAIEVLFGSVLNSW